MFFKKDFTAARSVSIFYGKSTCIYTYRLNSFHLLTTGLSFAHITYPKKKIRLQVMRKDVFKLLFIFTVTTIQYIIFENSCIIIYKNIGTWYTDRRFAFDQPPRVLKLCSHTENYETKNKNLFITLERFNCTVERLNVLIVVFK